MKKIIFVSTILSQLLFFSVISIIGFEYQGIDETPVYAIFCISFAITSLLIFFIDFIILKQFSLNGYAIAFFLLPLLISLFYFSEQVTSELAKKIFTNYLVFGLTSTFIGIYVARRKFIEHIAQWFEIIMLLLSTSVIISLIIPFIKGIGFVSFAGTTHQTASYVSALAYTLNLFYILFDNQISLFRFHYSKLYRKLSYILLLIQILGAIVSTGRGGFIVIALSSIVFIWIKARDLSDGGKKFAKILFIFIFGVVIFLPILLQRQVFTDSLGRVLSYISTDKGLDMGQTSGRDRLYANVIQLIRERPLTGYGLFSYYDHIEVFPHNFFLEILLNGGALLLLVALIIGLLVLIKFRYLINKEPNYLFLSGLIIFTFTQLMFSGTYLSDSLFWFIFSCILCAD